MAALNIGFIGLGLIGGSIARALRKFHPDYTLMASAHSRATLEEALGQGVIQEACREFDPKFSQCDYIFSARRYRPISPICPFSGKS